MRDPDNALLISAVTTGAGVTLLALAFSHNDRLASAGLLLGPPVLFVGPSLGHVYGEHHFGTPGLWVRAAGLAIVVGGAALFLADNFNFCIDDGNPCPATDSRGLGVIGLGAATMIGGAIWDIATARSTAEHYNRTHSSSLQLVPTTIRTVDHSTIGGLGIGGTF